MKKYQLFIDKPVLLTIITIMIRVQCNHLFVVVDVYEMYPVKPI